MKNSQGPKWCLYFAFLHPTDQNSKNTFLNLRCQKCQGSGNSYIEVHFLKNNSTATCPFPEKTWLLKIIDRPCWRTSFSSISLCICSQMEGFCSCQLIINGDLLGWPVTLASLVSQFKGILSPKMKILSFSAILHADGKSSKVSYSVQHFWSSTVN